MCRRWLKRARAVLSRFLPYRWGSSAGESSNRPRETKRTGAKAQASSCVAHCYSIRAMSRAFRFLNHHSQVLWQMGVFHRTVAMLLFSVVAQVGHSQQRSQTVGEADCHAGLQAYAFGDLQAGRNKMSSARSLDSDQRNLWFEFWEGVIAAHDRSVPNLDVQTAIRRLESAGSKDSSGTLTAELGFLWGLEPQQRGLFAYLHRGYYCSPDAFQEVRPDPPTVSPPDTTTSSKFENVGERVRIQLGSDGYIWLECRTYSCTSREWSGRVYDSGTHGIVAKGGTQEFSAQFCEAYDCGIDEHDIITLDSGNSYVIRLIDGYWNVHLLESP